MAIYGVKYELDFSDVKGNVRNLQILKKDYAGEVKSIVGTENPVIIRYNNDDDFYNPIIGSSCILNIKRTETVEYEEFQAFDEREFKIRINIGTDDVQQDLASPLWGTVESLWESADITWGAGTVFSTYWEGFLVLDTHFKSIQSDPYDIQLRAMDNLGTLDAYLVPDGSINTNDDGTIKTGDTDQTIFNSAFYYITEILKNTGLDFNIHIQNKIRKKIGGRVNNALLTVYHDIQINEYSLMDNFSQKNSKEVLESLLRMTNSRIFQANGSWFIISNSNYYDDSIVPDPTLVSTDQDQLLSNPEVVNNTPTLDTTALTATVSGTITNDRGLDIIRRGFYFGTNSDFITNLQQDSPDTSATFTRQYTGLLTTNEYYVVAFAQSSNFSIGFALPALQFNMLVDPSQQATQTAPAINTFVFAPSRVFNNKVTMRGQVTDIGTSNVTNYGFYFGDTSLVDHTKNTKYPVATGNFSSISQIGSIGTGMYELDTSTLSSPAVTLTPGKVYMATAYAINTTGENQGENVLVYTHNAMLHRIVGGLSSKITTYNSAFAFSSTNTLNDSGGSTLTDCYVLLSGQYVVTTPTHTINAACSTQETPDDPDDDTTCKSIVLFRSNSAFNVCCSDPTSRETFMNGNDFYDTATTKLYINSDCSTLLAAGPGGSQFIKTADENKYREWNGTQLQAVQQCPPCEPDIVEPNVFLMEKENSQDRRLVQYNDDFVPSTTKRFQLSVDSSNCYFIIESQDIDSNTGLPTIVAECGGAQPVASNTCPTMIYFREYTNCNEGAGELRVLGNNRDVFPAAVKEKSSGETYYLLRGTNKTTTSDTDNLGCFPTAHEKFDFFDTCDLANGRNVEDEPDGAAEIDPVVVVPTEFFKTYTGLESDCSASDFILAVKNTTNSFPTVITNGNDCFGNPVDGGSGEDGLVTQFTSFDNCPACIAFISTTTTQATTTTTVPCKAIVANVTTSLTNACCGDKTKTIYINSNELGSASAVYTDSACTTLLNANNYIVHNFSEPFLWNGFALIQKTCPDCP